MYPGTGYQPRDDINLLERRFHGIGAGDFVAGT